MPIKSQHCSFLRLGSLLLIASLTALTGLTVAVRAAVDAPQPVNDRISEGVQSLHFQAYLDKNAGLSPAVAVKKIDQAVRLASTDPNIDEQRCELMHCGTKYKEYGCPEKAINVLQPLAQGTDFYAKVSRCYLTYLQIDGYSLEDGKLMPTAKRMELLRRLAKGTGSIAGQARMTLTRIERNQ